VRIFQFCWILLQIRVELLFFPCVAAVFRSDAKSPQITLSVGNTVATCSSSSCSGWSNNILLTAPVAAADGSMSITFKNMPTGEMMYGWAFPTMSPTQASPFASANCGAFVYSSNGYIYFSPSVSATPGLDAGLAMNDLLTLVYNPKTGTMTSRVNSGIVKTLFTGLPNNLVPAVLFNSASSSVSVTYSYLQCTRILFRAVLRFFVVSF
jgi:hypothetical protein